MKRLNVRNGLKQRMNEILGTDSGLEGSVPGINYWSIQAVMIENLRRVVRAIVGGAANKGRPMKGLWLAYATSTTFTISEGIGFTGNGDVVIFDSGITVSFEPGASGVRYIYIKHEMVEVDADLYPTEGKKTGFIAKQGQENIIYDDKSVNSTIPIKRSIVVQSPSLINDGDHILLGNLTADTGTTITGATPSDIRGFAPNQESDFKMLVAGIASTGDVDSGGDVNAVGLNISGVASVLGDSNLANVNIDDTKIIQLPNGPSGVRVGAGLTGASGTFTSNDSKTITVTNGIITSIV